MSTHKLNAIKNTFPDFDLEIQKEVEPHTQLEEFNDYLRMLADMENVTIRRKIMLLEGYTNLVVKRLKKGN